MDPTLEKQLKGHKGPVTALSFNPVSDQLTSSSEDSSIMVIIWSIMIWNFQVPLRSYKFEGHTSGVLDVAYSLSGGLVASGSRDRTVRLWVPKVSGESKQFRAHSQSVRSVQFTSDGLKLLTSSDDKFIKLWSVPRQKFISVFTGHTNWVRCARMSYDNCLIASCSDDKSIKLWHLDSKECIHTYQETKGWGVYVAWHPTGCYLAVGLSNGTVKLYDTRTHSLLQHYQLHEKSLSQITFHPNGSYLLTCGEDNKMKILDLMEGHPIYTLSGHTGSVKSVAFSPNGDYFASAGDDREVMIWKTNFTSSTEHDISCMTHPKASKFCVNRQFDTQEPTDVSKKWYINCRIGKPTLPKFNHIHIHNESRESSVTIPKAWERFQPIGNSTLNQEPEDLGDFNHIPRKFPPEPTNVSTRGSSEPLTGIISLHGEQYCYTNGSIEWVGKKRNLRIDTNCSFKNVGVADIEPQLKRQKTFQVYSNEVKAKTENIHSYQCHNMPLTVDVILEHLNTIHDAIEIVDERLNIIEDTMHIYD